LQIEQKARDSHSPTAAMTAGLRLHFQCLDGLPQGYILKWLDAAAAVSRRIECCRIEAYRAGSVIISILT
jgi:hypothetical protein